MSREQPHQKLFNVPKEDSVVTAPARPKSPVDSIGEMVYALTDSIIVFSAGGWENDLPERLKNELPLHRLAHVKLCMDGKEEWEMACHMEALIYLYPASLAASMGEQWSRIYLYLGTRCLGPSFPEDIKRETLDQYDMAQLEDLKRWIRKKKVEARKLKKRGDKVKAIQDCKYEQLVWCFANTVSSSQAAHHKRTLLDSLPKVIRRANEVLETPH